MDEEEPRREGSEAQGRSVQYHCTEEVSITCFVLPNPHAKGGGEAGAGERPREAYLLHRMFLSIAGCPRGQRKSRGKLVFWLW